MDLVRIDIPADILQKAGLSAEECRMELALHLYGDRRIPLAQALRLCGLTRTAFEAELARHRISLYTTADLHEDLRTLRELGRL